MSGRQHQHPYNKMFEYVSMFPRQGGWATNAIQKRIRRLQRLLSTRNALMGLCFYFEGEDSSHQNMRDVAAQAHALEGKGFHHIIIIWFDRRTDGQRVAEWHESGGFVSLLQYTPSQPLSHINAILPAEDAFYIASFLEERYPDVFTPEQDRPNALRRQGINDDSGSSSEEDVDVSDLFGV
eukprot:6486535-Amphidinium_carterae.1